MSAVDDALAAMRDRLVSALHDQLRDTLDLARIVGAVDTALAVAAVPQLVQTAAAASTALTAYADATPTPPPDVVAAQGAFDDYLDQVSNSWGQLL